MRRWIPAVLLVASTLLASPTGATAAVPVVVIDGKGFGHGVGMAQEGAYAMAVDGAKVEQILGQFYPGTGLGKARGPVRVPVLDAGPAPAGAVLAFPDGGQVRESAGGPASPGFPVDVPRGGAARITFDGGSYRVDVVSGGTIALGRVQLASSVRPQVPTLPTSPPPPSTSTTAAPAPGPASTTTTTAPPPVSTPSPTTATSTTTTTPPPPNAPPPGPDSGPPASPRTVVAVPADGGSVAVPARQRRYRGTIEATAATGTLRFVNSVDVEQYLKGMGEVRDPSWPQAALRAQAIAARTYAMRAMLAGGEICDTQRCQVYLGAQAEYGAMNAAVDATAQQVLVYRNSLASAVYSANGGGFSASREEGFGVSDESAPYLRAAPYPTKDPGPWSVTVALTDVAARLGYVGQVTDVRVTRAGPSGRALEVTLDGTAGPKAVAGIAFDAALGLRSTLFAVRVDTGDPPPPPPPAEDAGVQAPPDEAAAIDQSEVAQDTTTTTTAPARRVIAPKRAETVIDPRWAVLALWAVTAAGGGAYVSVTWPRRRPSPSARRTEDGSP